MHVLIVDPKPYPFLAAFYSTSGSSVGQNHGMQFSVVKIRSRAFKAAEENGAHTRTQFVGHCRYPWIQESVPC